jgi:hypothetical protein
MNLFREFFIMIESSSLKIAPAIYLQLTFYERRIYEIYQGIKSAANI